MSAANANTAGKAEVKQAIQRWQDAIQTRDVEQIMANYTPDVVAYDAVLQLRFNGKEAYGKHWQLCLEMCTNDMVFEPADAHISVSGELALVYCLIRCGEKDESGQQNVAWMRMTTGYKKVGGQWLIEHAHFSAPFDMMSMKALFDLDPDNEHKVRSVPSGMNTVTPHLVCAGAGKAIEFYTKAFNAKEISRLAGPDGKLMHAEIRIGDSVVMLMDENKQWGALGPATLKGSPVTVHLYVDNADAMYEQAIAAGATSVMHMDDTFWGDRYGVIKDPFGHNWSMATHMRDVSEEEIREGAKGCA